MRTWVSGTLEDLRKGWLQWECSTPLAFRGVLSSLERTGGDPVAGALSLSPEGKAGESYGRPGEQIGITVAAPLGTSGTGHRAHVSPWVLLPYLAGPRRANWDRFLIGAQAFLLVLIHQIANKTSTRKLRRLYMGKKEELALAVGGC